MARIDEITSVLKGEHGPVLPRSLGCFRPVRRPYVLHLHVVVVEEALGRLGLRPIATGLIDRTLGHLCQAPTKFDESCRPSLIPQVNALKFFPCPTVLFARLHLSLPGILGSELSLEVCHTSRDIRHNATGTAG